MPGVGCVARTRSGMVASSRSGPRPATPPAGRSLPAPIALIATAMRRIMRTFDFTLILTGCPEWTDAACDALFEAGCDDALPGSRDGAVFLDFSRESPSLAEAVRSAVADVESTKLGLRVVR